MTQEVEPGAITAAAVHEALCLLYNTVDLATCTLAAALPGTAKEANLTRRAQALRSYLLDAIELLRPGRGAPRSSPASRAYECLTLRFISGMGIQQIAEELSISERQVYRDLRWAEKRLAALLSSQISWAPTGHGAAGDPLAKELEQAAQHFEAVDTTEALRQALRTVASLAQQRGIELQYRRPPRPIFVMATPGVLQQMLAQLLSAAIQAARSSTLEVKLEQAQSAVEIRIPFPADRPQRAGELVEAALRVAQAQGGWHSWSESQGSDLQLVLAFRPTRQQVVLIVEDNASAYALYKRYLEGTEWLPILAPEPSQAAECASEAQAAAIVLDIMMPQTDGWTVLQQLRHDARTQSVPVIVCSVVDDPDLAYSLGAAAHITKPLSRSQLLAALEAATRAQS
jgi:CheY-like chemotaxis protein/enamine deaminase RidA (YjgF/YER057c/UK114 family)